VHGHDEARTATLVLAAISVSHFLNDMLQSLLPALYPILKTQYALDFGQVGLITLTYQLTASLLQPAIGHFTDKRPQPYSLAVGMMFTLVGMVMLSRAGAFGPIVAAAALVGLGSAIFHPESSRVARLASGGRHGLAQSVFQVGGNAGSSFGPLLAAFIVVPRGQGSVAWFGAAAFLGVVILANVGRWYATHHAPAARRQTLTPQRHASLTPGQVRLAMALLILLMFSKYFYTSSLSNYYTFFLIHKFGVTVRDAQLLLFLYLGAAAVGTFAGGPLGDRFGRRPVIWWSIAGALPFTLALPFVNLFWTAVLSVVIGLIIASAFSAILVFAQELVPGRVGLISGMFFGLAFGLSGLGAALLGQLADRTSIEFVFTLCAFLPALGLLAGLLPAIEPVRSRATV
jgi:FSR family fosmidomycin resistance protein-like MFS transporter